LARRAGAGAGARRGRSGAAAAEEKGRREQYEDFEKRLFHMESITHLFEFCYFSNTLLFAFGINRATISRRRMPIEHYD
jgi:hypothetical protein